MFRKKNTAYDFLQQTLSKELKEVNKLIIKRAKNRVSLIPKVSNYLTEAGGKRLRPLLTLAAAQASGGVNQESILLATAVEFIHTATLLHDDVIDQSELRRGAQTANNVWDNKTVILVGDYLFSQAFEMMVETHDITALQVLSKASSDIIESEVYQLELLKSKSFNRDDYYRLIEGKTAKLFAAAMESGSVVATENELISDSLREYGLNLGMAFQIMDDYLDYFPTSKSFGKTVGNDFMEGKITLPAIYAINENPKLTRFFKQNERSLECFEKFMSQVNKEGVAEKIAGDLDEFTENALSSLDVVKDEGIKLALQDLVVELNQRKI